MEGSGKVTDSFLLDIVHVKVEVHDVESAD